MAVVDFYYGLGSRYSYLASTQIERIARETGARFAWIPLASPMLFARRPDNPFAAQAGGQYDWGYRRRDAEDWAALYGVPFNDPVGRLKHDGMLPALAALAARRQGAVEVMSRRLFRMIFVDERTAFGRDEVAVEAVGLGLDIDRFLADIASDGLAAEHDREIAAAEARGVFGVPTFTLGGRLFWGNDRLVLLEAALAGRI